jgi:hypothetical protein
MHFPAQIELIQDEMCYVAFMIPSTLAEAVTSYRQTDTNLRILLLFFFFTVDLNTKFNFYHQILLYHHVENLRLCLIK